MILNRLYELAERQQLLADPAFERLPVPYVVHLNEEGAYVDIEERRGTVTIPTKKKGAPPRTEPDKGRVVSVPKAHGNTANRGFARFFADTLPRVLSVSDDAKSESSRRTFWQQIAEAAQQSNDPALRAVEAFGQRMLTDPQLQAQLRAKLEELKPDPGDRCTFAWYPDGGPTILEREPVRAWYRTFYAAVQGRREEAGAQGLCQITREFGPLARSHTTKVSGVPGGMAAGVSLVSNDKAAFESYGLDGAVNASISPRAAEGYARALNELIHRPADFSRLFPGHRTCFRVYATLFVFWTRQPADLDDFMAIDRATSDDITRLFESVRRGAESRVAQADHYYCLCLSGNSARAIIRDYLEVPVAEAKQKLARWFEDLRTVDDTAQGQGARTNTFPLWMLAAATVRDGDDEPPSLPTVLLAAALKGTAVPDHVMAACLQRVRVESGPFQFRPARMGLIRLILNRHPQHGDQLMPEALDPKVPDRSSAYSCGRLLAFLARCQSPRSYGADAPILERYYGSASTAPQSVFPVLLRMNRHHLQKIRDDNAGFATNLEKELEERLAAFRPTPEHSANFPPLLSLVEQGQFALGFYHQRADYRRGKDREATEPTPASARETADNA
jgi:CRISPR-associated protein Csd1